MNSYRIIIPSRKRLKPIRRSSALFPQATIVVAEDEVDSYIPVVGKERIIAHPNRRGFAGVFNWCIDYFQEDVLFFVDDDVDAVMTNIKPVRKLPPNDIEVVIENAIQAICDLDLTVCCFSRTPNTTIIDPWFEPIRPIQPVCVGFGIRGKARRRRYDESLIGRADLDWTLRTLKEDRVIYSDVRFFFRNGRIFGGEGGNVGLVDEQQRNRITEELCRRWGKWINHKKSNLQKNRTVVPMRLTVSRKNPTGIS